MCSPKEPHFLINKEIGINRISIGITDISEYKNLFLEGKDKKYRGESSVMYLMYPEIVIPKINQEFGEETKIIIMLRNPVERAYSGYQHVKRFNVKEDCIDFKSAWDISEKRYFEQEDMTAASRYKELGLYYKQVKSYLEQLKNVHIIIYDDYKKDFQKEMNKVFDFLEIENTKINDVERHMVGGWQWEDEKIKKLMMKKNLLKSFLKIIFPFKSLRQKIKQQIQNRKTVKVKEVSSEDKKMLQDFYREDVQQLSKLLNRDLNHWII
tara:strand:- start:13 stop:813 length:801 start_codon:yes stop_codon:yes gene_type:complete